MTEKQIETENGTISYRTEQEKAIVTGFRGFAANLSLPSRIQGYPVTAIDRKAFLSQKSLCGICLPDTIQEVGDWAFAEPLRPGQRLTLEDMNHYTTVKTTMFNGIQHPDMVLCDSHGECHYLRRFTYDDYKSRMS